jgi:hypothetical protein
MQVKVEVMTETGCTEVDAGRCKSNEERIDREWR